MLQTQQLGEKCCIDDPILEDITLSDEALNWNGQKRCCMHNEGKRTLDDLDLDALIDPDLAKISDKIFDMGSKAKVIPHSCLIKLHRLV